MMTHQAIETPVPETKKGEIRIVFDVRAHLEEFEEEDDLSEDEIAAMYPEWSGRLETRIKGL